MEDVVLHYKPGSAQDLLSLIETTEKLLAPFPHRNPQVFSPWFPSIVDRHLPLRPARPSPIILSAPDLTTVEETRKTTRQKENPSQDQTGPEGCLEWSGGFRSSHQTVLTQGQVNSVNRKLSHGVNQHQATRKKPLSPDRGVPFVPETPTGPTIQGSDLQVQEQGKQVQPIPESHSKRCWTVFSHRAQLKERIQNRTQVSVHSTSRRFQQTVSKLQLHSRQRVKWLIDKNNCKDIEQVWRCLSRPLCGLSLPACCNAHIDRSQSQIWVYCDLFLSEQVGLSLKQGMKLRGKISLWERRQGIFYSL